MTSLISCANCWYDPLQSGSLGSTFGYCVEHKMVLRRPDETTCALQMRKDLLFPTAQAEQAIHAERFGSEATLKLVEDAEKAPPEIYICASDSMNGDKVANLVTEYGEYGTKIESLSQLKVTPGARAETAMLNLARAYTMRCVDRGGSWTSGLHLLWWTRRRLESDPAPQITLDDLRFHLPVTIKRQQELIQWSLVMLRLMFIGDVAIHAHGSKDGISELDSLPEDAARATEIVSLRKLLAWVRKIAIPRFDKVMGKSRYQELADELHKERFDCSG